MGFVRLFDYSTKAAGGAAWKIESRYGLLGLSSCEWLDGLFLSKRQGPSDRTVGVRSSSAYLSHCACRLTLSREHLFVSCCKCRHVCGGRSTGGSPAASIKPLKVIHDTSLRQFRLTRNAVLVDLESAAKECSSNGRERVEDAVGPTRRGGA
jgi:hypothetical protein